VAREEDAFARVAEPADDLAEVARGHHVEAVGGFVEHGSVVARGNAGELLAASGRDNLEDAFVRLSGEGT
jgi:hypothetical protein